VKIEAGKVTETVHLINWQRPEQNDFAIAEEVTLKGNHERRPDIVLYVNGIAVSVLELKNSRVSIGDGIRQSLSNQQPEFNAWFFSTVQFIEEKATDAPTMVRVLVDIVDGKLRREHPQVQASPEWHRFRELGTIGGCVALALRLHADVPEAYRTPLEMAMRNALEGSFPESEALYEDCVRSVREALLEVERPKRGAASFVLISMWVFSLVDHQGFFASEATMLAELAQIYQNETHNYWISTEVT
jgi:hypothetical protein